MAACALRPTAAGAAADLHAAVGASELAIFRKCGAYAVGSRCADAASLVTSDSWLPSRRWLQASSKAGDPLRGWLESRLVCGAANSSLVAEAHASARRPKPGLTSPAKLEAHRLVSLMRLGDGRVRHDAFLPKDNAPITKNFWFLMRLTASLLIQPRGQAVDTTITVLPRRLWAWAPRGDDASRCEGWGCYFEGAPLRARAPELRSELQALVHRQFPLALWWLHAAVAALSSGRRQARGGSSRPRSAHRRAAAPLPPAGVPRLIGVHVRRGDACANRSRSAAAADPTGYAGTGVARKCDLPLEHYVALAERAASRYGIRHAYLATDSEEMVRRASALSTSLRWFSGGASRERLQSAKLIEERVQAAELEPSAVVHGALVDLHFLARADVLIGHGGSMFSRLAFFLRWGRTGHVPPYVFVDGASGCCHPSSRACARLRNRTASGAGPPRAPADAPRGVARPAHAEQGGVARRERVAQPRQPRVLRPAVRD